MEKDGALATKDREYGKLAELVRRSLDVSEIYKIAGLKA
jgi:hypothetical protein